VVLDTRPIARVEEEEMRREPWKGDSGGNVFHKWWIPSKRRTLLVGELHVPARPMYGSDDGRRSWTNPANGERNASAVQPQEILARRDIRGGTR